MDRRTLLLFDFDGVIIDSVSLMERYVMKHWGDSKEQLRLTVEGNSHAKKDGSLPAPEDLAADAVSVAFYQDYGDGMTDCIVYDGMRQVLETLAEQHVLYVVSSTPTPLIARYLDHCGLAACFAGIYGVEVTPDKTKKIGMIVACEQIALRDCLMITDTLGDIHEAGRAGVEALGVTWGLHDRGTLERGSPWGICEIPSELPTAIAGYFREL